ncbi:hypothetical protein METBIDRAFT_44107 [Metschnikowia bicuspidata var. bicuspidata NRRL YB-4993]|uniref:BRCT domain-containing protein n=1 Tax=Metschnikowia bicuspidata var. bicuspidata NRRL YB-4993 TaxID=869754 RepID=A0A1A0HA92_9ASCO|nr:hypothetical protein METBIDRAFT_44107 [Metschnikowia bicuspidata var. bicuspidata NRRL YB-4993]OBA20793.1 hypothetical protein METBIDRAFT_44107 [Metschnikowia bicuspidata var. bicuspidata NRRL YB-4993]
MPVFDNTNFLVIDESQNREGEAGGSSAAEIGRLISENGGRATFCDPAGCFGFIDQHKITHVITETAGFADEAAATETMVPVTTGKWVWDSVALAQKRNYRLYAPSPAPFMDKVVVCVADNVAQGDKDTIYAGVRAFGGQYLDALLRYTTHLVALDLTNNKLVVAANIRRKDTGDICIVLPHWIDACVRQQRHVLETPYLLSNPKVLQTGKPDFSADGGEPAPEISKLAHTLVLAHKSVYLADDFAVYLADDFAFSEHLRAAIVSLIETLGGTVQHQFDLGHIDVYIGKHRLGAQFQQCFAAPRIDVASLHWLFHIATQGHYIRPLESNVLHFPIPTRGVPQFQNLRISITGISGDARHYLAGLIAAMGGTFTKTLDCNNDYLVCAQRLGDKYHAAHLRWPDVRLVNHLWIEECFSTWLFLDATDSRYASISSLTQPLGKTRLSRTSLEGTSLAEHIIPLDVDDSVGDSMAEQDGAERFAGSASLSPVMQSPKTQSPAIQPPAPPSPLPVARFSSFKTAENSQLTDFTQENSKTPDIFTPSPGEVVVVDTTSLSSPVTSQVRAGRSAKAKASLKLHSDMKDLNQYTSMSKSSRKMKSYMEQLEKTATPSKKKRESADASEPEPVQPTPKKQKTDTEVHLVAILTGCEQILTLTKSDVSKLLKVGIRIVNDYNPKKHIDTIVAPRVLRTEKFLKSLSKAQKIVHPSFLSDILSRHTLTSLSWSELIKEFNIEDYLLDKVVPVKQINDDLGVSGKASGLQRLLSQDLPPVFKGYALNFSLNLVGGADLISSILREHGLSDSKTVKFTAGTRKSGLLSMDGGTTILVAHKTKDKKAASKIEGVTVVEWEWCVKSIFHKKAQEYESYII